MTLICIHNGLNFCKVQLISAHSPSTKPSQTKTECPMWLNLHYARTEPTFWGLHGTWLSPRTAATGRFRMKAREDTVAGEHSARKLSVTDTMRLSAANFTFLNDFSAKLVQTGTLPRLCTLPLGFPRQLSYKLSPSNEVFIAQMEASVQPEQTWCIIELVWTDFSRAFLCKADKLVVLQKCLNFFFSFPETYMYHSLVSAAMVGIGHSMFQSCWRCLYLNCFATGDLQKHFSTFCISFDALVQIYFSFSRGHLW